MSELFLKMAIDIQCWYIQKHLRQTFLLMFTSWDVNFLYLEHHLKLRYDVRPKKKKDICFPSAKCPDVWLLQKNKNVDTMVSYEIH